MLNYIILKDCSPLRFVSYYMCSRKQLHYVIIIIYILVEATERYRDLFGTKRSATREIKSIILP